MARLAEHPAERDAVIGVCWFVLGVALVQFGGYGLWRTVALFNGPAWLFLLIAGAYGGLATQRSRHPLWALSGGLAVAAIDVAGGGSILAVLAITDLIYAAVKYVSDRGIVVLLGFAMGWVALTALTLLIRQENSAALLSIALQWSAIFSISALWGWNVRSERKRTSTLLNSRHARETERLRMRVAHDLHDLVANQIAVAGLHIEAAKLQAGAFVGNANSENPHSGTGSTGSEALSQSLAHAKKGTDNAHTELRRLIAALGALDDIAQAPVRPLEEQITELSELLPGGRHLVWAGASRATVLRELSLATPTTAALVLRVLRELVANSAKHGTGDTRCEAEVSEDATPETTLLITVFNTPRIGSRPNDPTGNRLGLRGIALVLDGLGGTVTAGIDPETGEWRAALVIPRAAQTQQEGAA